MREEVAGRVDRVLQEAKVHVEVEGQWAKSGAYTKDEVKIEGDKVACSLKKYVLDVTAERATPFLGQDQYMYLGLKMKSSVGTRARTWKQLTVRTDKVIVTGVLLVVRNNPPCVPCPLCCLRSPQ